PGAQERHGRDAALRPVARRSDKPEAHLARSRRELRRRRGRLPPPPEGRLLGRRPLGTDRLLAASLSPLPARPNHFPPPAANWLRDTAPARERARCCLGRE